MLVLLRLHAPQFADPTNKPTHTHTHTMHQYRKTEILHFQKCMHTSINQRTTLTNTTMPPSPPPCTNQFIYICFIQIIHPHTYDTFAYNTFDSTHCVTFATHTRWLSSVMLLFSLFTHGHSIQNKCHTIQ